MVKSTWNLAGLHISMWSFNWHKKIVIRLIFWWRQHFFFWKSANFCQKMPYLWSETRAAKMRINISSAQKLKMLWNALVTKPLFSTFFFRNCKLKFYLICVYIITHFTCKNRLQLNFLFYQNMCVSIENVRPLET